MGWRDNLWHILFDTMTAKPSDIWFAHVNSTQLPGSGTAAGYPYNYHWHGWRYEWSLHRVPSVDIVTWSNIMLHSTTTTITYRGEEFGFLFPFVLQECFLLFTHTILGISPTPADGLTKRPFLNMLRDIGSNITLHARMVALQINSLPYIAHYLVYE